MYQQHYGQDDARQPPVTAFDSSLNFTLAQNDWDLSALDAGFGLPAEVALDQRVRPAPLAAAIPPEAYR